jgi:hypothetical protein
MTVLIHKDSHVDHNVGALLEEGILDQFKDRGGFFIATVDLRNTEKWHRRQVPLALVGPSSGDLPVTEDEVEYKPRPPRAYNSRMLRRGKKGGYVRWRNAHTHLVTIIAGPHDGHDCVLFTIFGGPLAPKEPDDPTLKPEEREASVEFWKHHALADDKSSETTTNEGDYS